MNCHRSVPRRCPNAAWPSTLSPRLQAVTAPAEARGVETKMNGSFPPQCTSGTGSLWKIEHTLGTKGQQSFSKVTRTLSFWQVCFPCLKKQDGSSVFQPNWIKNEVMLPGELTVPPEILEAVDSSGFTVKSIFPCCQKSFSATAIRHYLNGNINGKEI